MADAGAESSRLKTLAEERYIAGNLKSALKYAKRAHHLHPSLDGTEELVTALEILLTAAAPISPPPADASTSADAAALPDYYRILQMERFANISTIKKQYRKLALALHPDKNPFAASEEAFKYVGEGFGVLSDRVRRKEYDTKLRNAMQAEAAASASAGGGSGGGGVEDTETFWTACSNCRLSHKFKRKYLGHVLVCPSCKKRFEAAEAAGEEEGSDEDEADVSVRCSERIKARRRVGKMVSVVDILARSRGVVVEKDLDSVGKKKGLGENQVVTQTRKGAKRLKVAEEDTMTLAEMQAKRLKVAEEDTRTLSEMQAKGLKVAEEDTRTLAEMQAKRLKVAEEGTVTLAEMQLSVKRKKVSAAKLKGKDSKKEMEKEKVKERDEEVVSEKIVDNTNVDKGEEEEEESREEEMEMERRRIKVSSLSMKRI